MARIRTAIKQANDAGESVTGLPVRPLAVPERGGVMSQNTHYCPSELTSLSRRFEEAALHDHSKWDRIVTSRLLRRNSHCGAPGAAVEVLGFNSLGCSFGLDQLLCTRPGQVVVGGGSARLRRPAALLHVLALFPVRRDLLQGC